MSPTEAQSVIVAEEPLVSASWSWQAEPYRLWSLNDMLIELHSIVTFKADVVEKTRRMRQYSPEARSLRLDDEMKAEVLRIATAWRDSATRTGLKSTLAICELLLDEIDKTTVEKVLNRFDQVAEHYAHDCKGRTAWLVDPDRTGLLSAFKAKGIGKAFPSAVDELDEADQCYELGRHTACVFHMMRAAEHALRVVVKAVGVVSPTVPVEYQQWQNLIDQIESRISVVERWPQPSKSNALAFFGRIIADFYAFKDDIRNVTMHTRTGGTYDGPGALSVINRVHECFERLATKIDETKTVNVLDPLFFA